MLSLSARLSRVGAAALLALSVAAALAVPAVFAHAELLRAEPGPDQVLAAAPTSVKLWFNEPIEVDAGGLIVQDAAGNRLDAGNARLAPDDARAILVDLNALAQGVYTVRWRVISVDTHVVSGSYRFSVGVAITGEAPEVAAPSASPVEVGLRWLSLAALSLLVGGFGFRQLVLQPGLRPLTLQGDKSLWEQAETHLIAVVRWGTIALLLLNLGQLWYQLAQVSGQGALQALDPALLSKVVMQSRFGTVWLARMVFTVALFGVLDQLTNRPDPRGSSGGNGLWWLGLGLGLALLLTSSLASHAAARQPEALALAADWLHVTATVAWLGGLFHLVLLGLGPFRQLSAQRRGELWRALLPPFTRLAVVAVQVLLVTGMVSAWLNLVTLNNLVLTDYGRVLLVKLALVAGLLALGGLHFLVLSPRLLEFRSSGPGAAAMQAPLLRWLSYGLRGEAGLGLAVLLAAGVLASTPPAPSGATAAGGTVTAASTQQSSGVTLAQGTTETLVVFNLSPAAPGSNTLRVELQDLRGQPPTDARVEARVAVGDAAGADVITLAAKDGGYNAVVQLPVPGRWSFDVRMMAPGKPQESTEFTLTLPLPDVRQRLVEAETAMNALSAMKERQELRGGPGGAAVVTEYRYQAPDKVSSSASNGAQTVFLGSTRYTRDSTGGWSKVEAPAALAFRFPDISFAASADQVALLGRDNVDGGECDIISFVQQNSDLYFRLWIGAQDNLVRRMLMMGPGHFMDTRYYDFNVPNPIVPPQ